MRPCRFLVLVAALIWAAGVGAPPARAAGHDKIALYAGPDRQHMLEKGARAEGKLMLYTSMIVDQAVRPLKRAFEAKYPFVKLDYIRAGSSKLVQRLLAEHRARSGLADVVAAGAAPLLKKVHIAQKFSSPVLAPYPRDLIDPEGMWATVRLSYNGFAYNTRLVKAQDAPKTWEDLLDPRWKGKMVWPVSTETGAPFVISILEKVWGKARAMDYLHKLAKQNVHTDAGSARHVLDQVIAGEYPVMISAALHHVMISAAKGAPVAAVSPTPLLGRGEVVVMLTTAPHPHAAMLFVDFLLSKEGQSVLRAAQYLPAHPDVDPLPEMAPILPRHTGARAYIMGPDVHDLVRQGSARTFQKLFPN